MTMDLTNLRIGYVPYNNKLDQPGDNRRFFYYAKKRNIAFEIADPAENYDLVIVSERGDLSVWSDYRRGKAKVVYDFIDSYLAISRWNLKGILRGFAKYATGQSRYMRLNHWKAIEAMCRRADAVICTTDEQRQDISKFCKNVRIILDIHTVYNKVKTDYSAHKVFNLVWEGYPHNLPPFFEIKDVLKEINAKRNIALHLVTNLTYGQFMGKYWKRSTADIARKIFNNVYLYDWNKQLCPTIICACDMAVVPLFLNDPLSAGKPEDKLALFWRMGMPAIVSATPAHAKVMSQVGLQDMACRTPKEWKAALEYYIANEPARRRAGECGRIFAETQRSEEMIFEQWDNLLTSVLGK